MDYLPLVFKMLHLNFCVIYFFCFSTEHEAEVEEERLRKEKERQDVMTLGNIHV